MVFSPRRACDSGWITVERSKICEDEHLQIVKQTQRVGGLRDKGTNEYMERDAERYKLWIKLYVYVM